MLDESGLWLTCSNPCHAADDRVFGVEGAEGYFVADAILDDDESC